MGGSWRPRKACAYVRASRPTALASWDARPKLTQPPGNLEGVCNPPSQQPQWGWPGPLGDGVWAAPGLPLSLPGEHVSQPALPENMLERKSENCGQNSGYPNTITPEGS